MFLDDLSLGGYVLIYVFLVGDSNAWLTVADLTRSTRSYLPRSASHIGRYTRARDRLRRFRENANSPQHSVDMPDNSNCALHWRPASVELSIP
jgi:hypothetical protein